MELEGVRLTLPFFVHAMYRIIPIAEILPLNSKINIDQIQRATYKLCGTIMSNFNRFSDLFESDSIQKFPTPNSIDPKITKFVKAKYINDHGLPCTYSHHVIFT